MLLKTKHRAAIYSTGEIWGFESACSVSNHIIAERWRHARTKVTPQVLKSSIAAPPHPVFLLSHHLYFSPAFIFPVCSSAPFRSSSPTFLISRQMISETGFIPRPSSLPSICQSRLIPDCLPSISLPLSLYLPPVLVLIWLPFLTPSFCFVLLSPSHTFLFFFDPPRVFLAFHRPLPFLPHRFSIKRPVLLSSAPFSCGSSSSSDAIISDLISIMPFYILHFYSEMTETWLLNITSVKERLQRPFMVNLFLGFLPKQPALLENIIANLISCFEVY